MNNKITILGKEFELHDLVKVHFNWDGIGAVLPGNYSIPKEIIGEIMSISYTINYNSEPEYTTSIKVGNEETFEKHHIEVNQITKINKLIYEPD